MEWLQTLCIRRCACVAFGCEVPGEMAATDTARMAVCRAIYESVVLVCAYVGFS